MYAAGVAQLVEQLICNQSVMSSSLFTSYFNTLYNNIYLNNFLLKTIMNLLAETIRNGIVGFFKFYSVMLTLRVYLTWFPNINFYQQPFNSLGKMTDPYLRLFRGIIPPLLAFDISPLLAFLLITFLIDILSSLT